MKTLTAGKGDPYWYEWTVGLIKVVEMLHPESTIKSVSFQVAGAKGWDDVVVRHHDDRADYIQVKNSRVGRNITFGDLVATDEDGASLLSGLYEAWRDMNLNSRNANCILFTNRGAGERPGVSEAGVRRPPLSKFIEWLKAEVALGKTLQRCKPDPEWADAWNEWRNQLKAGSAAQRLDFLKAFTVETNQEDLRDLEAAMLEAMTTVFQITPTKARPLLQALDSALRHWTTEKEQVTAEEAFSAMALNEAEEVEHRAPPPPAPFFPSRQAALVEVENALIQESGKPVVFLSAEPGAGKTSLISQLANRRVAKRFEGAVCLRYFAFRPITPDSPLIPPDADDFVRPDKLWFSLLSQLREALKGSLRAFKVPLRNDLLTWSEARAAVLRIARDLGRDLKRPFTIVIDGIDHAARAMRFDASRANEFFQSLPSPDEIRNSAVRVMLAGQPAQAYPEYPVWLRNPDPNVQVLGIGKLDPADILALVRAGETPMPPGSEHEATQAIMEATHGNTLAVVFAVEEFRASQTLEAFSKRLTERRLGDGLGHYYSSIWHHALNSLGNTPVGTTVMLATALCLTPERLTGALMVSAFASLGLTKEQWCVLFGKLGPLVVEENAAYRVLHNDVRVFLHSILKAEPEATRRQAAGFLADYYLSPKSARWFAHKSLFRLLGDAGRKVDCARVFSVAWVFEAVALGMPCMELSEQCAEALRQGVLLQDWDTMMELACSAQTFARWEDTWQSESQANAPLDKSNISPSSTPLRNECYVPPMSDWNVAALESLTNDAEALISIGQLQRTRSLLLRWLSKLSVCELSKLVPGLVVDQKKKQQDWPLPGDQALQILRRLGRCCRVAEIPLECGECLNDDQSRADYEFELGWVQGSCEAGPYTSVTVLFFSRIPRYVQSYKEALEGLVEHQQWGLVRDILCSGKNFYPAFSPHAKAEAAWWAIQSGAATDYPEYAKVLSMPRFGLPEQGPVDFSLIFKLCRALGWTNPGAEARELAMKVWGNLPKGPHQVENTEHYLLLFRAAVTLGQLGSCLVRRGSAFAADMFPPREATGLLSALWEYSFPGYAASQHRYFAGSLATDLVSTICQFGPAHQQALVEAATPHKRFYPVDHRLESLWKLHRTIGDLQFLREWVRRWLGNDGWLWADDERDRDAVARELLPLARSLGEDGVVREAEGRLSWLKIRYSGHKEYSFSTPIAWFEELTKIDPPCWRDLGLELWTLSEACSAQGGDNRSEWALGESIGAAAWACGPDDVWCLFTTEYRDCGTHSWLAATRNRIVSGLRSYLLRTPKIATKDKLAAWCLAVGLCRWFDDDSIKQLHELRTALLASDKDAGERDRIAKHIEQLTPGEACRESRPESWREDNPAEERAPEDLQEHLKRIEGGAEVEPTTAIKLLRQLVSTDQGHFHEKAPMVLEAIGVGGPYNWAFHKHGYNEAILELPKLTSDSLLWCVIKAATKYAGAGSGWGYGVSQTLYHLMLARAIAHGKGELQKGLKSLLRMHELWARGGNKTLMLAPVTLGSSRGITGTSELASYSLLFLLNSRSAEIIESALTGIHTIVANDPGVIELLLSTATASPWQQHWILNSAEVWATVYPEQTEKARTTLEIQSSSASLHLRMQAWLILFLLAKRTDQVPPDFPRPPQMETVGSVELARPAREILASPSHNRGAFRFVDKFHSAESTIDRVCEVTGANLTRVKSDVASRLMTLSGEEEPTGWIEKTFGWGDTRVTGPIGDIVLDEAFDRLLQRSPLPEHLHCSFSQAYLNSEDPWIYRQTPIPDDSNDWPSERDLEANSDSIRQKLLLLATQNRVPTGELVLAAKVQAFTYKEDFALRVWWQEDQSTKGIVSHPCPTTLNGRTFAFHYGNWWEPQLPEGSRPLTFGVGGHNRLTLSSLEMFPAAAWLEFGWTPSPTNPLVWLSGGDQVARYERLHGPPRSTRSGHPRQPLMNRWLVKRDAWEVAKRKLGPLRMFDDFERLRSDVEH
jgi:hypothetical protein